MTTDITNIDPRLLEEDDRIAAYLKGQMTAEEEQQFLKDLEANPDFKEKAIVTARLVKGLKEVGSQRDALIRKLFFAASKLGVGNAIHETIRFERAVHEMVNKKIQAEHDRNDREMAAKKELRRGRIRRVSAWTAIAASLVGAVWLGIGYYHYQQTTGLGAQYGDAFPTSTIVRGADAPSAAGTKLERLFTDVKDNKDLDVAIHELSLCWEVAQMETYNDYTDYAAEICWNLAIAYLKDNDRKNAEQVLVRLVEISEEGSAVNKQAQDLLDKLK